MKLNKTAMVIGATGLIGAYVTEEILQNSDYDSLTILVRNSTLKSHPKLKEVNIDFGNLSNYKNYFHVDELYICLGTTRKKAGTKEKFRKVDYDFVVEAASLAKECGVKKIAVVSAIGADPDSKFFYNQVKGEMEEEVASIGIPSTYFFRPSLLLGDRREFRLGEKIGEMVSNAMKPLFIGSWKRYRPVHGKTVARAMVKFMKNPRDGIHVVESDLITKVGEL